MSDVTAYHVFVCALFPAQGGVWTATAALEDIWFIFRDIRSWNRPPSKAELHKFSKNLRKFQNSMRHNVDMKEFPYRKPTIFSCHLT